MRLLDRKSVLLILLFCLPLLFLPKINLVKFSEKETAGLRLDDIILLSTAFLLFWARFMFRRSLSPFEKGLFVLVGFSFISFFSNRFLVSMDLLHVNAKIFYCVRILEYATFFYVGALAFPLISDRKIIYAFFLWNLLIMTAQKLGIVGGFNSYGYGTQTIYRVTGIASFPSEMGVLLNLIFCYIVFDTHKKPFPIQLPQWLRAVSQTAIYWQFILFAVFIVFTGSRIALAALMLSFLAKVKEMITFKTALIIFAFIACLGCSVAYLVLNTEGLRSQSLLSFKNVEIVKQVWEDIDTNAEPVAGELVTLETFDLSWWMRIHKWIYALKIYFNHPESYLQGIGPGFAFAALDGGLLRILTENGLIGAFLYWMFFASIYHQSKQLAWMVLVFVINMIFFDVYLAYKPMILLFFVSGYTYARQMDSSAYAYPGVAKSIVIRS